MSREKCFKSFLGPEIERFIAHKRSLGRRYSTEERSLVLLDAHLLKERITSLDVITPAVVDGFLLSRPRKRPRSYNHLRSVIGQLFSHLVSRGMLDRTPLQSPPRRGSYQRNPFIFDRVSAKRLLAIAKTLHDSNGSPKSGAIYFALFAILYGLGLRVGEACRLSVRDVDLERRLLIIRETKFYKTRLVPFGSKLEALISQHLRHRQTVMADQPLFSLRGGRAINPCTVSQVFHALVPRLGLEIPPGVSSPRLHDLRHSFAVGVLTRWYRLGIDPQARLLDLSTFLGHVDVTSTAVYLTTTPELLEYANNRFKAFAAATLAEVAP